MRSNPGGGERNLISQKGPNDKLVSYVDPHLAQLQLILFLQGFWKFTKSLSSGCIYFSYHLVTVRRHKTFWLLAGLKPGTHVQVDNKCSSHFTLALGTSSYIRLLANKLWQT